jgi:16S rRNA (guanine(966)-N(2))-methyltransferase RsmD
MRVIAGKYRSRKLMAPPGLDTRPTSDRLRETLFNVVAGSVPGSVWLDLFAGTGAVGIEALSRGAREVHFVESSGRAVRAIRANLASLGITQDVSLMERDTATALRVLEGQEVICDFCFLDPPYRQTKEYEQVLSFLSRSRLLAPESVVIAEHDKHTDLDERFGRLHRFRKLRQGDAVLSFFRLTPAAT